MYHGTSANNVESILEHGIRPRGEEPSQWPMASAKDRVYLTTAYAPYFAICTTQNRKEDTAAIIEVDLGGVPNRLLAPDEDWCEQVSRAKANSSLPWVMELMTLAGDMETRTAWFRDNIEMFQDNWDASLKGLGTLTVLGTVPVGAITRVCTFKIRDNPLAAHTAMDPTITLTNYKILGDRYLALTEWFFGAPVDEVWAGRLIPYVGQIPGLDFALQDTVQSYMERYVTVIDV